MQKLSAVATTCRMLIACDGLSPDLTGRHHSRGGIGSAVVRRSLPMARTVYRHSQDLDVFLFSNGVQLLPVTTRAKIVLTRHDTTASAFPP